MNCIRIGFITMVVALGVLGCSQSDTANEPAAKSETPVPGDAGVQAPATPEAQPAADAVMGAEVQLAGTLGCGHCNYHVTEDCAAVVRTANGDSYVLDGVDENSELWAKRLEPGHKITVSGKIVGIEPVKHVALTSFELD